VLVTVQAELVLTRVGAIRNTMLAEGSGMSRRCADWRPWIVTKPGRWPDAGARHGNFKLEPEAGAVGSPKSGRVKTMARLKQQRRGALAPLLGRTPQPLLVLQIKIKP
jgi:hypothetical protein